MYYILLNKSNNHNSPCDTVVSYRSSARRYTPPMPPVALIASCQHARQVRTELNLSARPQWLADSREKAQARDDSDEDQSAEGTCSAHTYDSQGQWRPRQSHNFLVHHLCAARYAVPAVHKFNAVMQLLWLDPSRDWHCFTEGLDERCNRGFGKGDHRRWQYL